MGSVFEKRSLALVVEAQAELASALNSLTGKTREGLLHSYCGFSARHINHTIDAYIYVRQSKREYASALLIRPCVEMLIKVMAVMQQPDLLFRIAHTERLESKKLLAPLYDEAGIDYVTEDQNQWNDFRAQYAAAYPNHILVEKPLSVVDAARTASLLPLYNRVYRWYCRATHGVLAVTSGSLDGGQLDSYTMAICGIGAIEAVKHIGGESSKIEELKSTLQELGKQAHAG